MAQSGYRPKAFLNSRAWGNWLVIPFGIHRRIPLVRRPFYQRDQAIRERDALAAELNLMKTTAVTAPQPRKDDDGAMVERIIAAYVQSVGVTQQSDSFWDNAFFKLKRDIHDALIAKDRHVLAEMLQDPGRTDLFYGFENLARSLAHGVEYRGRNVHLDLLLLSEAIGVERSRNPEYGEPTTLPDVEPLLERLDEALGATLQFPNPFPGEVGLATSRGVASYRAVQAIFQAWRIAELVDQRPGARVLEIGAGLGRTAYYATQFGVSDYTIIDIPLSNVAQAAFLGRALGTEAIRLFGEDGSGVRILPPPVFLEGDDTYDLVVNVDSLTELARDVARSYAEAIKVRAAVFLSINHEHQAFTVRELFNQIGLKAASRAPYWMRRGYVEEVFPLRRHR
ncbi:MAG: putative sugar O-methyltransferase [Candidatus Dormiibacterota bacterium]